MLPYRYQSLKHNDSIRVLVLHPSLDVSAAIICTLQHARLSDTSLEYEALSYTWGDAEDEDVIFLHGGRRQMHVRRNCFNALRHLRGEREARHLWIDAICIDQENIRERTSQVRMMDRIYDSAWRVVVHLGEETEGTRLLFEELTEADKLLERGEKCKRPPPSEDLVQELEILLQRPWFRRVWVLQEVCAKRLVMFMCGPASASFKALQQLCFGYRGNRVTKDVLPYALSLAEGRLELSSTAQFTLWDTLLDSRQHLATDPRDRVFSLKSLLGAQKSGLEALIDYNRTTEETFTDTAMYLMSEIGLLLLIASRHPHELKMPSWIPDWSQNLPLGWELKPWLRPDEEQQLSRDSVYRVHYVSDQSNDGCLELIAEGCQYAQIMQTSHIFFFSDLEDARSQREMIYSSFEISGKVTALGGLGGASAIRDALGPGIAEGMCIWMFSQYYCSIMLAMTLLKGEDLDSHLHKGEYGKASVALSSVAEATANIIEG